MASVIEQNANNAGVFRISVDKLCVQKGGCMCEKSSLDSPLGKGYNHSK